MAAVESTSLSPQWLPDLFSFEPDSFDSMLIQSLKAKKVTIIWKNNNPIIGKVDANLGFANGKLVSAWRRILRGWLIKAKGFLTNMKHKKAQICKIWAFFYFNRNSYPWDWKSHCQITESIHGLQMSSLVSLIPISCVKSDFPLSQRTCQPRFDRSWCSAKIISKC